MEIALNVNDKTCIKCGKCVRVCPAVIFTQEAGRGKIGLQNVPTCISCGHCVAVCPTSSITHSEYPAEKIHKIDASVLPTPDQFMLLCKARRSNRAFSAKQISEEALQQILEAAHRAPTASNQQQIEYTLVTNPDKLRQITEFTLGVFAPIVSRLENPFLKFILKPLLPALYGYLPTFDRLVKEYAKGNDLILRKATAVILIHTPEKSRFSCADANLAYQNGSLMAESLGVSQFYTGFVCAAIKQDKKNRLAELLGIKGTIEAGMALGIPDFRYPNYIDRKEIKVNRL